MNSLPRIREAEILQAAAVAVAAPRYMGAFAYALGRDLPAIWPAFASFEIWSGLAMALLEGWAVAYMFRHWRRMQAKSTNWKVTLAIQIVLLICLPIVATPYLVGAELGQQASAIMPGAWVWAWKFIVAAIAPLVVAAVGYTDPVKPAKAKPQPAKANSEPAIKPLVASKSEPKPAQFRCEFANCGRTFASQPALNAHQRIHSGQAAAVNGNGNVGTRVPKGE